MTRHWVQSTVSANTRTVQRWWETHAPGGRLEQWFTDAELEAASGSPHPVAFLSSRLAAKAAVQRVLRTECIYVLLKDLALLRLSTGAPVVELPSEAALTLAARGLGVQVSVAHAERRVMAAAVLSRQGQP